MKIKPLIFEAGAISSTTLTAPSAFSCLLEPGRAQETFANSITIPPQGDDFDPIRVEYTQMLQNQLARGNNGLIKTKYLSFSIEADSHPPPPSPGWSASRPMC